MESAPGAFERTSLALLDLPNEVLSYIIDWVSDEPPLFEAFKARPLLRRALPESLTPLKNFSRTNHRLRKLSLPFLFQHVRIQLGSLDDMFAFVLSSGVDIHACSAFIQLSGPTSHQRPYWWQRLLKACPRLSMLTIAAPPHVFAEITQQPVRTQDAWAYNIDLQMLQLRCKSESPTTDCESILQAKPWDAVLLNEASSLAVYTSYEYFLRRPPSSFTGQPTSTSLAQLSRSLHSFTYVGIFPTYTHIAEIVGVVKTMLNLRSLSFKTVPDPVDNELQTIIDTSQAHFDLNDPWNELETSLVIIADAAKWLSQPCPDVHNGPLRRLLMEDVATEGMRETIEDTVNSHLGTLDWSYEGSGLWRRPSL